MPLPSRYHNFIIHRAFVLKLPIFQYFYWNNFFNLNFCYIVFCGAGNCIVWYMNHIYNSIKRSSGTISHIAFMIFFKNATKGFSFTIFCILSIANRFSFAALLICCRAMYSEPNCGFPLLFPVHYPN